MRFANVGGRLALLAGGGAIDVATESGGRFSAEPQDMFDDWDGLLSWAAGADNAAAVPFDNAELGPPVPQPSQVFAVALNYHPHAVEAGFVAPEEPLIFTKFPSCITGPFRTVTLPPGRVDWEIELVVVFGRAAYQVSAADGWAPVAGVTVGQDLSERVLQMSGQPPQFSLAKSHEGFGPIGPALVTLDELTDPDDLELRCEVSGELMQHGHTRDMVFSVPELVAHITRVCAVRPGDVIFTGTPAGVGNRRTPPRFLGPQDELVSAIEGVGEMRHRFVPAGSAA